EGENSWLVLSSNGGTLAPGESDDITLTFDANFGVGARGLDAFYEGAIKVLSNDADNPEVTVPVTFAITGEPGGGGGHVLEEGFDGGIPADWAVFGNEYCCQESGWVAFTVSGEPVARSRWSSTSVVLAG